MANYLYNGVELPDINTVWTDKTAYPYAGIVVTEGQTMLAVSSVLFECYGNSGVSNAAVGNISLFGLQNDAWVLAQSAENVPAFSMSVPSDAFIWSSFDIMLSVQDDVYNPHSYNGIILPGLPEWDTATYPYACVMHFQGKGYCASDIFISSVPFNIKIGYLDDTTGEYLYSSASDGGLHYACADQEYKDSLSGNTPPLYSEGWGEGASILAALAPVKEFIIWTNADICYENSTEVAIHASSDPTPATNTEIIYFAGSDPVPVGGVPDVPGGSAGGWSIGGLNVKGLTIPEGKVVKAWITIDGVKHLVFSANVAPEIIGSLITSEVCVYEDEYYESVGEDVVYDDWGIGYFYLAPPDKYDATKGCWSADDVVEYCVCHDSGYNRYDTPTWPLDDVPDISQYAGWYMTDDISNLTMNVDCELYVIAGNSKLRDDDWTKEDPADIQGGFGVYLSNYYKAQKKKV